VTLIVFPQRYLMPHAALRPGAGGGAWTPASLASPYAYWDVSVLSSLFQERTGGGTTPSAVDGVVGTIRDLTGNSRHLEARADGQRAILRTAGGLYYLQFDGSDDAYTIAGLSPGTTVAMGGAWTKRATYVNFTQTFGFLTTGLTNVATFLLGKSNTGDNSGLWADGGYRVSASVTSDVTYVEDFSKVGTALSRLRNSEADATYTMGADRSIAGEFNVGFAPAVGNSMYWYGAHVCLGYGAGERDLVRAYWAAKSGVTL